MPDENAIVIATYSRRMRLRLDTGDAIEARIKGKRLKPVCGDRVLAVPIENESDWLILNVAPRDTELTRPDTRGRVEVLAANFDCLVVVAAAQPSPDWYIVDRYLCAAELIGVTAIVVYNKSDLLTHDSTMDELDNYRRIGYEVVLSSTTVGDGIEHLAKLLRERCAIIVGQSGVGKSSIINCLVGDDQQRVAGISEKTNEGRHTTVNSAMISLPEGGTVIDSPGVRDYAPALQSSGDAANGFREVAAAAQHCRFANCRHLREPGCHVKTCVENGSISERRYASYKRIVNLTEQLSEGRY